MLHRSTTLFLALTLSLSADPLLSSWYTKDSGQYARIYETLADQDALNSVTTWSHPNNGSGQALPTYAGVNEIAYTNTDVYIRTTGLGFHIMGPWYDDEAKQSLYENYPANIATIYRLPIGQGIIPTVKIPTGEGPIGYFVDGISMFDSRDTFSYNNLNAADAHTDTTFVGDEIWNRDVYVNESVAFDPANAHLADIQQHYHVNPPALRNLLSDSVDYDYNTNTYTENFNGTHSPILGWVSDGHPIYGPYGYDNPLDAESDVRRMRSGYTTRDGSFGTTDLNSTGRTTLPDWAVAVQGIGPALASNQYGPTASANYPIGHYLEDYDYLGNHGQTLGLDFDLDVHNGRFCVTPEFPNGTYAYFVAILQDGTPTYPYNIGRTFYGNPTGTTVNEIPETAITYFEGGPEIIAKLYSPEFDSGSGDVTLVWSGPEGGTYRIEKSDDLTNWKTLDDTITNNYGSWGSDDYVQNISDDSQQFFRSQITALEAFDDNGFQYAEVAFTDFVAEFSILPPLNDITSVTVGSVTATILDHNSVSNTLKLDFDSERFTPGSDHLATIHYTPNGGTPTTIDSINTHEIAPLHNILLMIVDDWAIDSSPIDNNAEKNPGTTYAPMPNLEALAARGLRFTNAYAQPVCSPTRASIITGRYAFRHSVGWPEGATLPTSELTLPEIFTAEGSAYKLASYGKWHLGGDNTGPLDLGGWTEFRGILGGGVLSYTNWSKTVNGATTANVTTYTTTDQVNETITFINAQTVDPWFVWIGFNAPHTPFHNPPTTPEQLEDYPAYPETDGEVTGANRRFAYEAALQALDTEIGRLLESVDLDTTNIIIIGDNGTPGAVAQAPYTQNHSKGTIYDGGIHVPLVIAGPDVSVTGTSHKLVHCVDLFSTILDLANIDVEAATNQVDEIDSQSIVPILKGQDSAKRFVVSEVFGGGTNDGRTIISSEFPDYKLIIFGDPTTTSDVSTYEMYHLSQDANEQAQLPLPAVLGDPHYHAYTALIAKDTELSPAFEVGDTLYLHLDETRPRQSGAPQNLTEVPSYIEVDGVQASFLARVDENELLNQYWVKCTVPDTISAPYAVDSALVTFTNMPNGDATRILSVTEIIIAP